MLPSLYDLQQKILEKSCGAPLPWQREVAQFYVSLGEARASHYDEFLEVIRNTTENGPEHLLSWAVFFEFDPLILDSIRLIENQRDIKKSRVLHDAILKDTNHSFALDATMTYAHMIFQKAEEFYPQLLSEIQKDWAEAFPEVHYFLDQVAQYAKDLQKRIQDRFPQPPEESSQGSHVKTRDPSSPFYYTMEVPVIFNISIPEELRKNPVDSALILGSPSFQRLTAEMIRDFNAFELEGYLTNHKGKHPSCRQSRLTFSEGHFSFQFAFDRKLSPEESQQFQWEIEGQLSDGYGSHMTGRSFMVADRVFGFDFQYPQIKNLELTQAEKPDQSHLSVSPPRP